MGGYSMYTITFKQEAGGDIKAPAQLGENILTLAQKAGIAVDAPCSGNGTCGKCRLLLIAGYVNATHNTHLSSNEFDDGWRLACQSTVQGDATFLVPSSADAFRSGIQTADFSSKAELERYEAAIEKIFEAGFDRNTRLETIYVTMEPPSIDDTTPDNERLIKKVIQQTGMKDVLMSNNALGRLPKVLRDNDYHVKCLLRRAKNYLAILDVRPEHDETPLCGLAVDIGTTTVAATLIDLENAKVIARASAGNAQIRYGADVINRIIQSDRPGGRIKLQTAIREETLYPLIEQMYTSMGIEKNRICRAVIASNTTMNHLFAGVPAGSIRLEPYVPVFRELPGLTASEFNMPINQEARVVFAPNVGSYVGGDITAGAFATMLWNRPEVSLFIDLGTNGELVLGSEDFLLCCACSAGPAFEGGDISCGMRATAGAIEAFEIDAETMEPTLKIIGGEGQKPAGLCGSGIIDIIAELFRSGVLGANGKFVREGRRVKQGEYERSYVFAFADESATGRDVEITEVDIDNFIRAKAAIFSAIYAMLEALDMDIHDIETVYIAGGIGSGINIKNAISIGMLPSLPLSKYEYIGNSSLTGACAMLLSAEAEWKVHKLGRGMTYLELSTHPGYMDAFVAASFLPHTDASLFPPMEE